MNEKQAIGRLKKLIGPRAAWRVDNRALTGEAREEARAKRADLVAAKEAVKQTMEARRKALLEADAEYQSLVKQYNEALAAYERNRSELLNHRITVGKDEGVFFHVKAQGDTWQDVIDELEGK